MRATLSYRNTVEMIRRLNGGTVGFDYGRYKLAELRAMVEAAIADGTYEAEQADAVAEQVAAEAAQPAQPFAPSASPVARPLPKLGKPAAPVAVPQRPAPDAIRTLPVEPQPAPVAAPVAQPAPVAVAEQPAEQPAPVAVDPAPVAVAPVEQPAPVEAEPRPAPVAPSMPSSASSDAPARMPLAMAFPRVKLPALSFPDCAVYSHPDTPATDPHYIFDPDALAVALAAASAPQPLNVWLYGPPGTGKTEFARQFAARTGRPFFRIQFDRNAERSEFLGSIALKDGATVWTDGTLLQAYRTPGAVILLDEITYGQQGNIAVLNGMLEATREFRIAETGELVRAAPGVVVFAADNTNGTGDASGLFIGTGPLNVATANRFAAFVRFDYLGKTGEARVLRDRTGISKDGADAVANLLHVCRQKADSGAIASAPTLREAVAMAVLMRAGIPAAAAYETSVVARAIPESQEELRNLFAAHFPPNLGAAFAAFVS